MEYIELKAFRKANHLTQDALGEYLGIKKSFISQVESGKCPFPQDKFNKLLNNPYGWDTSALVSGYNLQEMGGVYQKPYDEKYEQIMDIIRKMQTDAQSSKRDDGYIRRLLEELAEVKAERDTLRDENAVLKYQLKNKGENAAEAADHSSSASAV